MPEHSGQQAPSILLPVIALFLVAAGGITVFWPQFSIWPDAKDNAAAIAKAESEPVENEVSEDETQVRKMIYDRISESGEEVSPDTRPIVIAPKGEEPPSEAYEPLPPNATEPGRKVVKMFADRLPQNAAGEPDVPAEATPSAGTKAKKQFDDQIPPTP